MRFTAENLETFVKFMKEKLLNKHISHPFFYASNSIFFHLSGKDDHRFVISLDDTDPRFYTATHSIDGRGQDSRFLDQFQKEVGNAYIIDMECAEKNKIVKFSLTIINSVYKEEARNMYFEMIPHHANLIVTDADDKIIVSYRPGDFTDARPLYRGMTYSYPPMGNFKHEENGFDSNEYLKYCLSKETEISARRKKDRFGHVITALKAKEKSLARKIIVLQNEIEDAKTHLDDSRFGDAIYICYGEIKDGAKSFEYEGKTIKLDPLKSLPKNAEKYYKNAKKAKQTIAYGEENILKTEEELQNISSALKQVLAADEEGLEVLEKDLGLSKKTGKKRKDGFDSLSLATLPYQVEYKGTHILYGKTSKQNDCLTFLFATSKNHMWLHIMGDSGSHVVIKKDDATADEIRVAAEIALINSHREDGEVMYTLRRNVRKGNVPGQAIVKVFESIRIDNISNTTKDLLITSTRMDVSK